MAWVDRRTERRRQPQRPLGVNRSSSLAKGLTRLLMPGVDRGCTPFGHYAMTGVPVAPIAQGLAGNFTGSDSIYLGLVPDNSEITVMAGVIADSAGPGQSSYIFGTNYDGGSYEPLTIRFADSVLQLTTYYPDLKVSITPPAPGEYCTIVGYAPPGSVTDICEIGYFDKNGAYNIATSSMATANRATFGYYLGSGANISTPWRQYAKPILWAATWSRRLSVAERAAVARNPWQVFEDKTHRAFRAAASAGFLARYYYDMIARGGHFGG